MKRIEHREGNLIFPFVKYSPEVKSGKLPLIVQLHGAGERGSGEDIEKVDVNGFSKYLKNAEHNCIVVMPQCPENTFWAARVESIIRFIEKLIEEFDIDKDRVYLTGLSMGGYGTWFTAMARPGFVCRNRSGVRWRNGVERRSFVDADMGISRG